MVTIETDPVSLFFVVRCSAAITLTSAESLKRRGGSTQS